MVLVGVIEDIVVDVIVGASYQKWKLLEDLRSRM